MFHAVSQGQSRGRCRVRRRAEDAIRAGTVTSVRRMVAVRHLANRGPVRVAAARVRLNAMTASTSQAALALNRPTGYLQLNRHCLATCATCAGNPWDRVVDGITFRYPTRNGR